MTEHVLEPSAQLAAPPGAVRSAETSCRATGRRGRSCAKPRRGDGPDRRRPRRGADGPALCTQAQLRRFIKSRPYVPLHELRRRFGLNGPDDDVAPVDLDGRRLFVGLPGREAGLLGELLRQGDVGYELLLDPTSPVIIGVFPMRPVQRA